MSFLRAVFKFTVLSVILLPLLMACTPSAELVDRHQRSEGRVQAAALSSDGKLALVATNEEGLRLYDTETQSLRFNWQQEDEGISQIVSLAFSPDNQVVLAASRMTVVLWNTHTGEVLGAWRNDESFILDVAVSNGGQHLVLARNDGIVVFFEPRSGRRLEFQGHDDRVNQVKVSANGRYVLSGGNDHLALLWDTQNVGIIHRLPAAGRVTRIALDSQGRLGMVNAGADTYIYNLVTGERTQTLRTQAQQKVFSSAVFSPSANYLLTGTASRQIELWSTETGQRLYQWTVDGRPKEQPPRAAILAVAFRSDSSVVSESSAGYGERWRLPDFNLTSPP